MVSGKIIGSLCVQAGQGGRLAQGPQCGLAAVRARCVRCPDTAALTVAPRFTRCAVQAEEERAAAQAKRDFFTAALTELRLAQSNVTRAVVEAQQRCAEGVVCIGQGDKHMLGGLVAPEAARGSMSPASCCGSLRPRAAAQRGFNVA